MEKDYLPPLEPGQAPYSDASKERFKEKAYDRYYTKVEKYNELRPKMYSTLLSSFSIESKVIVSQHCLYLKRCVEDKDCDVLANIVSATHYTQTSGDNPLRKHNMRAKREMQFGLFRMTSNMNLGEFYKQFVEHRRILTAQKDEVPVPKREAQNFILRLDGRYAEMITSMDNGSITGKPYPASLAEAYEVARLWVVPMDKKVTAPALALVAADDNQLSGSRDGSRGRGGGKGMSGRAGPGSWYQTEVP